MFLPKAFYPLLIAGICLILALPWIGGLSLFRHYHGLLHSLPAQGFTLTTHLDTPVALSQLADKPVLLSFGYRHCQQTCPSQRATMQQLASRLQQQAHVVWVSLTPEIDKLATTSPPTPKGLLELYPKTTAEALTLATAYRQKTSPGRNSNPDHNDYIYLIDTTQTVRLLYQGSKVSAANIVEDFYKLSP